MASLANKVCNASLPRLNVSSLMTLDGVNASMSKEKDCDFIRKVCSQQVLLRYHCFAKPSHTIVQGSSRSSGNQPGANIPNVEPRNISYDLEFLHHEEFDQR